MRDVPSRLLGSGDPPPVEVVNPGGRAPVLLICDHASNRVPSSLGGLGLDREVLGRHVAWDIGAGEVARGLARLLDAPAVLAGYSRLVIDPNRDPADPASIPVASDGHAIPGNVGLAPEARAARMDQLFDPYHRTIDALLGALAGRGRTPALFSVHSFTPRLNGTPRPWHVGVLWNRDPRLARPLLTALADGRGLVVGDNLPYDGKELAFSLNRHGGGGGLANCAVEIRQDEIATPGDARRWASLLAGALAGIIGRTEIHRAERF